MSDNITLPREVVQEAIEALERYSGADQHAWDVEEALRAALDAEQPKPSEDIEALRRDAERLQDVVDSIYVYANDTLSGPANGPETREWHREGIIEIRNRARQLSTIGSAVDARAAIDAAMQEDKT